MLPGASTSVGMLLHARRKEQGSMKLEVSDVQSLNLNCVHFFLPPTGLPSPPRAPSYTVQQYGQGNVTLIVQWLLPQYDGGVPVNYTITVSPGLSPVTTSETSVPVTVPYNEIHTVSIVATNCNGSSSAVMVTISAIGMLQLNDHIAIL